MIGASPSPGLAFAASAGACSSTDEIVTRYGPGTGPSDRRTSYAPLETFAATAVDVDAASIGMNVISPEASGAPSSVTLPEIRSRGRVSPPPPQPENDAPATASTAHKPIRKRTRMIFLTIPSGDRVNSGTFLISIESATSVPHSRPRIL